MEPRLLRRRALGRRRARRSSCRCRSARSSSTTRSGRGPAPCRGSRAGSERCTSASGRLPWPRLVEPALRLARGGVVMPPAHAACLAMLGPVFTMQPDGERIYAPAGRLLETGETLAQPGLARGARAARRRGRRQRLPGLDRRAARRGRGRTRDRRRPGALRGALGGAGRGDVARAARAHARWDLRGAGDAGTAAPPPRSRRDRARARPARRAGRARRRTGTRQTSSPRTPTVAPAC